MELGQKIRQARLDAGLSQRQLCGDAITRNMLSQIENGSARPSMDTLRYLADRLQKSISFFLEEETVSVNQSLILAARSAYSQDSLAEALSVLSAYQAPDPIFDPEYHLLCALCRIRLAAAGETVEENLQLAYTHGKQTPYYTAAQEHRRLLILASHSKDAPLPSLDDELLIHARHALRSGDAARCAALLDVCSDQDVSEWLILRADAAMAAQDYTMAVRLFTKAELSEPVQVWPKLEQCYLQLENYKMAYEYACKQR